jgi:D-3-phosphoglycerate dehydrogenase
MENQMTMDKKFRVALIDYDSDLFDLSPAARAEMERILAEAGAELSIGQNRSEETVMAAAEGCDVVMIQSVRPLLNSRTIPGLPKCRGIIRMGLGYDSVDVAAATQMGIPVSNVIDWCNDEVAEHAIALLMAGARKVALLNQVLHSERWSRDEAVPIYRLRGKTLGLVGLGRVAQAVALRLQGFGMNLVAFDPYLDADFMKQFGVQKVELELLLRQSDFISIHARLTEQTIHLIGAPAIALIKPGAFLINTSRGPIVDEAALISALQEGKLRGAALDVMEREPLPADSPLRKMGNVILTPHIASYSVEAVGELYCKGAEIAAQMLAGKWVHTIVNSQVKPAAEQRWGKLL